MQLQCKQQERHSSVKSFLKYDQGLIRLGVTLMFVLSSLSMQAVQVLTVLLLVLANSFLCHARGNMLSLYNPKPWTVSNS